MAAAGPAGCTWEACDWRWPGLGTGTAVVCAVASVAGTAGPFVRLFGGRASSERSAIFERSILLHHRVRLGALPPLPHGALQDVLHRAVGGIAGSSYPPALHQAAVGCRWEVEHHQPGLELVAERQVQFAEAERQRLQGWNCRKWRRGSAFHRQGCHSGRDSLPTGPCTSHPSPAACSRGACSSEPAASSH